MWSCGCTRQLGRSKPACFFHLQCSAQSCGLLMIHSVLCDMAFMEVGSQIPPLSLQLHLSVSEVDFGVQVAVCTVQERPLKMEGN